MNEGKHVRGTRKGCTERRCERAYPNLLDALEGLGQQGEKITAALNDVFFSTSKFDALLLEDLRVEPER